MGLDRFKTQDKPSYMPETKEEVKADEPVSISDKRVPRIPKGTVYINKDAVRRISEIAVGNVLSGALKENYVLIKRDELEKLRKTSGTQLLIEEYRYRLVRRKTGEKTDIEDTLTVGIDDSFAGLVIRDNKHVSRRHAVLTLKENEIYVRDLGSSNHTYVDGTRIPDKVDIKVHEGSVIRFADDEFIVEVSRL